MCFIFLNNILHINIAYKPINLNCINLFFLGLVRFRLYKIIEKIEPIQINEVTDSDFVFSQDSIQTEP